METHQIQAKKYEWQDIAFILFLLVFLGWQLSYLNNFYHPPGQLFGGDQYYHLGHVFHIYNGGSVFESSHFKGEYEHYPWLTHVLVAFLGVFISPLKAFLIFPFLVSLAGVFLMYIVGKKLFDKTFALLLAMMWMSNGDIVLYTHPTATAAVVILPLVALAFFLDKNLTHLFYGGFILGIAGLGHITAFLGAMMFFSLKLISEFTKENLKKYFIVVSIGILISLLFYYPLLFIYKGKVLNNWQEYSGAALENLNFTYISNAIFPIAVPFAPIIGVLIVLGMYFAFKEGLKLPLLLYFTGVLGVLHPFITKPLLGTSFGFYRFPMWINVSFALFSVIGLRNVLTFFSHENRKKILFCFFLFFLIMNIVKFTSFKQDDLVRQALVREDNKVALFKSGDWIIKNTDPKKVFIAPNPVSALTLNSVTGRKVSFMYRNHANAFVELEKRIADMMIILYGNNTVLRKELMKNYSIGYYFEDSGAYYSMVKCLKNWEGLEKLSPDKYTHCVTLDKKYVDYLRENGVNFKIIKSVIAPGSGASQLYDLVAVKPVLNLYSNPVHKSNAYWVSSEYDLNASIAKVYRVI